MSASLGTLPGSLLLTTTPPILAIAIGGTSRSTIARSIALALRCGRMDVAATTTFTIAAAAM